jgi:hypothetical protein
MDVGSREASIGGIGCGRDIIGVATAAETQVDPQIAKRYFDEITRLCESDAGLPGVSLCGPMVIFEQATATRATSQPEPEGPSPPLSESSRWSRFLAWITVL